MNEKELKESVYSGVITLALSLARAGKTMTSSELTEWINKNYPGFEHPYGNARGVPQAAFRRAKERHNVEGMMPWSEYSPTMTVRHFGRSKRTKIKTEE